MKKTKSKRQAPRAPSPPGRRRRAPAVAWWKAPWPALSWLVLVVLGLLVLGFSWHLGNRENSAPTINTLGDYNKVEASPRSRLDVNISVLTPNE